VESPSVNQHSAISLRGGPPPTLDPLIGRRLRAVVARLRGYVLIEGLAWTCGFLLAAAAAQFLFDYGTRGLRWSIRAALLGMILAFFLGIAWRRLIRPLRVRIDAADVANLVERRFPHLSSALISAVRFSRGEAGPRDTNSPTLITAVVDRAATVAAGTNFNSVLDARRAKWSAAAVAGVVLAAAALAWTRPHLAELWFARNVLLRDTPWPKQTHLTVELRGDEVIGARGDDLVIEAFADGVQPSEVEFFYETAGGQRGRENMVTVGSPGSYRYRYTFKNAQEDFAFHLRGGDDQTDVFRARLVDRPQVTHSTVRVAPPAYAGLGPFVLAEDQRAVQMLPGSAVTISIETNKPVVGAELVVGNDPVATADRDGDGYTVTISPRESQTCHFHLVDDLGFDNREPVRFALRVVKDEAPRVRLKVDGAGEMITPQAVLPVEVEFADTYGLATADLFYRLTHEDMREDGIPFQGFEPGAKTFATSLSWAVAEGSAVPGDRLSLLAASRDFDDVSGPNAAESPQMIFRIVTPDELLAELARREQEFRMDFERLIDAQEQLRGRLLTLMGPAAPAAGSPEFTSAVSDLERRQRSLAQSVSVVRQQIEQVLAELRINQLSGKDVEERLGVRIAEPLGRLVTREFPAAADMIRRWSREAATEVAGRIDQHQVAILSQMREILANMIQWEGYQEAVTMLRDILRLQNELKTETQDAIESQAGDIFDK